MNNFHNILFVTLGTDHKAEGLKQAISVARNNNAKLKILILVPEMPDAMPDYRKQLDDLILTHTRNLVETASAALHGPHTPLNITYDIEGGSTAAIRIIQHAIKGKHDLVIKDADVRDGNAGFKALDMSLLRKCPCPVWLCRPIPDSRENMSIAVAIDPESPNASAHALSIRMLKLGRAMADTCNGTLNIISCWDLPYEAALRDSAFLSRPENEIEHHIRARAAEHREALQGLLDEAGQTDRQVVHHLRGIPEDVIPSLIRNHGIDVLIMGTVARGGIAGFIMGNTAENIVQNLTCSLLALKPDNFVSPVKTG
ncbi:universal stress protein [Micavibrio aeruginosavorus]|uniref:Universal stress protein family 1 n=1 Tax=Micavibrio aeruginosavorus EPB TaxID=349215 RepID=M4VZZ2_9BACT|nr:universal stress protein [Micavibrio aeruginosavorus]AGH98764.1 Universal stress protein family 1 [Micavibrio aeruginosavorus EPB]